MIVRCPNCNKSHNTHCNTATICYCGFNFYNKAKVVARLEDGVTVPTHSKSVGYQGMLSLGNITDQTVEYNGKTHKVYLNKKTNEMYIMI